MTRVEWRGRGDIGSRFGASEFCEKESWWCGERDGDLLVCDGEGKMGLQLGVGEFGGM